MTKYLKGYFIREDIKMENKHMKRCLPSLVMAAAAKSPQSCLTLCNPIDSSAPGSAIPGTLQARTLEWAAMPSSRDPPDIGIEPLYLRSLALAGGHVGSPAKQSIGLTKSISGCYEKGGAPRVKG